MATLTAEQVAVIRWERQELRSSQVAAEFGVSRDTIKDIRAGRTWKQVPAPARGPAWSVFENYIPVPESGCWLWLGAWQGCGYGHASRNYGNRAAQRLMYEHLAGPIPEGMLLCHKCDTPPCVNPDHMFLGTDADNAADKSRKGRAGGFKLTREQVAVIAASTEDPRVLAYRYGVQPQAIRHIQKNKGWTQ